MKLNIKEYHVSDVWICPAGVGAVIVLGQGGGAAGQPSISSSGGPGGLSTFLTPWVVEVSPNTTYVITVGRGGYTEGNSNPTGTSSNFGSVVSFYGAINPESYGSSSAGTYIRGFSTTTSTNPALGSIINSPQSVPGGDSSGVAKSILSNEILLGSYAQNGSTLLGNMYGGAGNSSDSGIGGAGGDAVANGNGGNAIGYGAGGGGAGTDGTTPGTPGSGGNGRIIVMWVE